MTNPNPIRISAGPRRIAVGATVSGLVAWLTLQGSAISATAADPVPVTITGTVEKSGLVAFTGLNATVLLLLVAALLITAGTAAVLAVRTRPRYRRLWR